MAVKAREIREMLQGKVDPGVIQFMCAMAEDNMALSQQLMELAQMFDKMVEMTQGIIGAVGHAKGAIEKMQGINPADQRNVELDEG